MGSRLARSRGLESDVAAMLRGGFAGRSGGKRQRADVIQVTFWCEKTAVGPVQIVTQPPKTTQRQNSLKLFKPEACGMEEL